MFLKMYNLNATPRFCGVISAILGLSVIFGWYTQNEPLIQILPQFAPMQYNTALGFLLAGIGLCGLTFNRSILALFCGASCFILGLATLTEYILNINIGLDEFFMEAYLSTKTTHPGRMAPFTALCFTLFGLSLMLGRRKPITQICLGTSILSLSILALIGYLINVEGVYGWGNLTRMAIHTAVSFLILSLGIISFALIDRNKKTFDFWRMVPPILSSVMFILTLFSWYGVKEASQVRNLEYFDRLVSNTQDALLDRFNLYQQSLLGGVGMFYASESVERVEWRTYVEALEIEKSLPGIAGIGFIASIEDDALKNYLETIRLDGAPNFLNKPETTFSDKFIITYIEPEDFNAKAIGLDIGFENNRREAAEYARDNGLPALTKKIILVQDGKSTPGFLLLVPVYRTKVLPNTLENRRENFQGWVYAPFIASDFMQSLSDINNNQIGLMIYDGNTVSENALIYATTSYSKSVNALETQTIVGLAEQEWTVNWYETDEFSAPTNDNLSLFVLISGILLSALLYFTLFRLLRSKEMIAREVERQTHKLAKSEARLKLVFDNAGEGIFGLNRQGHITFANKAAQKLLGYELEEMQNSFIHDLIQHSHPNGKPFDAKESHIISTINDGRNSAEDGEVFWHKDGTPLLVEYISKPILDDKKDISGAVIVFRDIAERKAAEALIKQANTELEEFAYRTSHDLRSPLVSSITLLGVTEKAIHADNKKKALTSLNLTQTSLKKLEELVKDLLLLTQTQHEHEEEQAIELEVLIEETLSKLKHMDNFERLHIEQDLQFSGALTGKKNRIVLIVENLISNAIKYQDITKDTSKIKISTQKIGNDFVLTVEDNGLGVPKDQQANLFKMFKRFHPRTSFGSGLGLYMMRKSAHILGGEIYFEDINAGSRFKVIIPSS